jgi:GNAT superfamily N-acetyltransferase
MLDIGKEEIYELGIDKKYRKWFIKLLIIDEVVHFDVVDEIHKNPKNLYKNSITNNSGFRWKSNNIVTVDDIVILPEFHNHGIGTLIMQFIETYVKSKGARKITGKITIDDDCLRLRHFHDKLGYTFTPYSPKQSRYVGYVEKIIL